MALQTFRGTLQMEGYEICLVNRRQDCSIISINFTTTTTPCNFVPRDKGQGVGEGVGVKMRNETGPKCSLTCKPGIIVSKRTGKN